MRAKSRTVMPACWVVTVLCLLPAAALAQSSGSPSATPPAGGSPSLMERQHVERRAQIQLIRRDCDDMLEKIRETNGWMEKSRVPERYLELGRHLSSSVMQVRDVADVLAALCDDPSLQQDKERLRDLDRLKENVRLLLRVHDRSHLALRKLVRMP